MRKLYTSLCRRWGPREMTISAWAWVYAQETGNTWPRNRIDGLALLFFGQANHCQASFHRHTRK
jgi:hypothetical protein